MRRIQVTPAGQKRKARQNRPRSILAATATTNTSDITAVENQP